MDNMLAYLDEYGSHSFAEQPFGEVDNLVLSELAYLNLREIVPAWGGGVAVSLREARARYVELARDDATEDNDPRPVLDHAAATKRFGDCQLVGYDAIVDPTLELQYGAVSYLLDDGTCCVVFRGTDNSIVGWREDFSVLYTSHTQGQRRAARYLEDAAERCGGPLIVCGHSKGGNLAMYATAFCSEDVRVRVMRVYSNDGIGFAPDIACSPEFMSMSSRMSLLVPQSSFIGVLLESKECKEVVLSAESGLRQHDPYSWVVTGDKFVRLEQCTHGSILVAKALKEWLQTVDVQHRKEFVAAVFDAMEEDGATTVTEFNEAGVSAYAHAVVRAVGTMEPRLRRDAILSVFQLANAGASTIANTAARQMTKLPANIARNAQKHRINERP
ncbi:MAG: DUF2974 domain-containing protein [Coriobacteriales bacterium]|nr:DUF2974 domain-containing protein [Coriobacteriales bacterium]